MKIILSILILSTLIFFQCSNSSQKEENKYQYKLIDIKKESLEDTYNEMLLYTSGYKINIDSLKLFCQEKKKEFTDGMFHIIVFFDEKQNASFPNNPITGLFSEENQAKHIKAIYTFNTVNEYSKISYYEKNSWESKPIEMQID